MALSEGARLGPYEIVSAIGAGGMGEVYRARDTRLNRIVAIKVLPEHLADRPEQRQRLEREAKAISTLNHPNICTLYDIGHQDGVGFLVMEYLEGETLAERLRKGALAPDQALPLAAQIAAALALAHRNNVTHRDLKPANVMLTKSGAKLLDFGLAKVAQSAPGLSENTATMALTTEGTILGTFQYMSPEQLEGKDADPRSDVFAFGAVLHEMLTGRKAFNGPSQATLITEIMAKEPPPVSQLQPLATPALDRVVKRCLAKLPDERWQSMSDLEAELRWIAGGGSSAIAPAAAARPPRQRLAWSAPALVLLLVLLAAAVWLGLRRGSETDAPVVRLAIVPPDNTRFGSSAMAAVSPEGRRVVFVAIEGDGRQRLWLQSLDSDQAKPIAGTEDGGYPFWSPDGKSIAFFTSQKLRRVGLDGGAPVDICNVLYGTSGNWGTNGEVLFSPAPATPIFRVPAAGGSPMRVTKEASAVETHYAPQFLDAKRFLFSMGGQVNGVYVGTLESTETKLIVPGASAGRYMDGRLFYMKGQSLCAQTFDPERGVLTGEVVELAQNLDRSQLATLDVASSAISYQHGVDAAMRLIWFDRKGKPVGSIGDAEVLIKDLALSPDGSKLAAVLIDNDGPRIWIYDVARQVKTKLAPRKEAQQFPAWSPDGTQVVYGASSTAGLTEIRTARVGVSGDGVTFYSAQMPIAPRSWSPDGKFLAISTGKIMILPAAPGSTPTPFLNSPAAQRGPRFSPDGKWIAYSSDESGRNEIYVAAFPSGAGQVRVSPRGGSQPQWRRDGKELFYLAPDGKLIAASVTAKGGDLKVGEVTTLFETHAFRTDSSANFDVSKDGERFIIADRYYPASLTLLLNWKSLLKSK